MRGWPVTLTEADLLDAPVGLRPVRVKDSSVWRETRIRNDFVHKLSIELANSHGLIVIEDLRIKNLTGSAKGTLAQPGVNVAQKRANAKRDCAARPAATLNMLT